MLYNTLNEMQLKRFKVLTTFWMTASHSFSQNINKDLSNSTKLYVVL